MPPKSACWPPRNGRHTARKSIPCLSPASSASSSSTAIPALTPLSSTAISESPSQETLSQTSPAEITPAILTRCTNSDKTLATDSDKSVPAENEEAQVCTEGGNCAKEDVNFSCDPVEKRDTSIQIGGGEESGTGEVVGAGKGTRKVIRRTVRVVKRVIKKRVPKKVLAENVQNGVALSELNDSETVNVVEKTDKLAGNVVNEAGENSNVVAEDIKEHLGGNNDLTVKPVGEGTKKLMIREKMEDAVKLDDICVSGSIVGESCDDKSGIAALEKDLSHARNEAGILGAVVDRGTELNGIERMETGTSKVEVGSCGLAEVGEKGNDRSDLMMIGVKSDEVMTVEVDMNDADTCCADSGEEKKVHILARSVPESERSEGIDDSPTHDVLADSVKNESIDISAAHDVGIAAQNLGSVEEKHVVLVEGKDECLGKPESGNDLVNNPSFGSHESLLLSGEMEALERKKRRKTEIFVGGLHPDAKEDDIRKAFDGAGALLDVTLVVNKTGKSKGFAFVKFSTASDANNALMKYSKVEIYGKQCVATPVEGNDTIFLGNIERSWNTENVTQMLEKAGIVNIDKITLKTDPNNIERNRGFAFVEFETNRDAKNAYNRMQKKNIFGKNINIRVDWAQPLAEPAEEEILKVKSVYAEYLPSSWNEEKVKEYFKTFGEIETVALAKDLSSSRRKDFAFINYTTREAALACIEAVSKERFEDNGTKVKLTVSLAKPITMRKQTKHATGPSTKQLPKETPKVSQASIRSHEPRNKGMSARSTYDRAKVDTRNSTNDELVHILRQQASVNHVPLRPSIGSTMPESHFRLPGGKRPYPFPGHDQLHLEPRGSSRMRVESSNPFSGPSSFRGGVAYHQQQPGVTYESIQGRNIHPGSYETRERAPYFRNNSTYHRY